VPRFSYQNLSGGEKAAFDLLLDFLVKKQFFNNTVFCIDEPEAHMNTRLQGALMGELVNLLPPSCQLWLATHSIGMMRAARDLENEQPGSVVFLDFGDHNFDEPVILSPVKPTRTFWERVLNVALDDLAQLVTPEQVIICEGNPTGAVASKNAENDEKCYTTIFEEEFPQTKFVSGGNSKDVVSDRLIFAKTLQKLAAGLKITGLIDKDDHAHADVANFLKNGTRVLFRRNLEGYLFDDEVLQALAESVGKGSEIPGLLADKADALADSVSRGNAADDFASAAGALYVKTKQRLALTGVGNDHRAFMRNTLAPLFKPTMQVYKELRKAIFDK
jgi:AAA domain, putative AbiEii toxin, Type IV TA system